MTQILALFLYGFAAIAHAAIHEEKHPRPSPEKGVKVPKSTAPMRLQCWIDGRQQIVEAYAPQVPPMRNETSTRVLLRNGDGTTTIVVVPGAGASGCLPVR